MNKSTFRRLTKPISFLFFSTALLAFSLVHVAEAANPAPVDLGTAAPFVILTKSGITNVPISKITGDLGVSPIAATAITGFSLILDSTNTFSTSSQVTGKIYAASYAEPTPTNLTTAVSNMETAYTDAAGRPSDFTELYSGDLSGNTLSPGVYKWSTGVLITSDVTLAGPSDAVWIFQIAGNLTMGSGAKVVLSGGAKADKVFWQVGGGVGVEIGSTAHAEGTILAAAAVNFRTGATLNGRILAQTAAALDNNILVLPSMTPQKTYFSVAANDGWILENNTISGIGGSLNNKDTTIVVGDSQNNKQYRGILHFNTASLPDTAIITSATLRVKQSQPSGADVFTMLGNLVVDIQRPFFGSKQSLQIADFQAGSGRDSVAAFDVTPVDNWFSAALSRDAYGFINQRGVTQLRLRFTTNTNNDSIADYLRFLSGTPSNGTGRPELMIGYYVPVY